LNIAYAIVYASYWQIYILLSLAVVKNSQLFLLIINYTLLWGVQFCPTLYVQCYEGLKYREAMA